MTRAGVPPAAHRLRPAGADDLGLRRALSDRLLPLLVGAMAFLAALALAGAFGAAGLARRWQAGAGSVLTIQVPQPDAPSPDGTRARSAAALAAVQSQDGVASARLVPEAELADLLRPWLGTGPITVQLPAVIEVRLSSNAPSNAPGNAPSNTPSTGPSTAPGAAARLSSRLAAAAPGTLVEEQEVWINRLAALARSLQACAGVAVGLVGLVSAAVVAVATRSGLAARRDAIEIVHGLGATRGYIAGRFARRVTLLATLGGATGAAVALPVLLGLSSLAQPFSGQDAAPNLMAGLADALPAGLWLALPCLPGAAAAIGWLTAQGTVRRWLRRLP